MSHTDWSLVNGVVDKSPGGVSIEYIRQVLEDRQSIVAVTVPVTGSLISSTLFSCRDIPCTARSSLNWTVCGTDWVLPAGYQVLLQEITECWTIDADFFSVVDNRAGVTFGVELYVPWDAPEAVVDVSSAVAVPLRNVADVFGPVGRRDSVTESCVLQGREARSIRVLVPDCRGLDQNFHYLTVVDMGDLPESHAHHMMWWQRELEEMRKAAKVKYRLKHPSPCICFGGTLIVVLTVCKGTPQDLMDHVRGAHNVPGEIKKVRLETLFPPQTVTCQVYTDSLTSRHSGISNDVLLFSDIGLSLIHHYRVHKRGLPHVAFRRNSITSPYYRMP